MRFGFHERAPPKCKSQIDNQSKVDVQMSICTEHADIRLNLPA